jgi:hypothetical protein
MRIDAGALKRAILKYILTKEKREITALEMYASEDRVAPTMFLGKRVTEAFQPISRLTCYS